MNGRNIQLPAVHVYSQCGARDVRGACRAVFCDIELNLILKHHHMMILVCYTEDCPVTSYRFSSSV